MSIHVCECEHNGHTEHHLRYPGMTEQSAQALADLINSGALDATPVPSPDAVAEALHQFPDFSCRRA